MTDTSTEAVKRSIEKPWLWAIGPRRADTVALLRALAAERDRLLEALISAERSISCVRGAISTGQIVDKDALGTATRARDAIRAVIKERVAMNALPKKEFRNEET